MGTGPGRGGPIPDKRDEERLSIVRSLWWTHRDGIFISLCAIVSAVPLKTLHLLMQIHQNSFKIQQEEGPELQEKSFNTSFSF